MKGNCMTGCIHDKVKDIYVPREFKDENGNVYGTMNEFVGYEHFCDKCPECYKKWHERNKDNAYEVYKEDCLDCYEPTEIAESLGGLLETAENILEKLNSKK